MPREGAGGYVKCQQNPKPKTAPSCSGKLWQLLAKSSTEFCNTRFLKYRSTVVLDVLDL